MEVNSLKLKVRHSVVSRSKSIKYFGVKINEFLKFNSRLEIDIRKTIYYLFPKNVCFSTKTKLIHTTNYMLGSPYVDHMLNESHRKVCDIRTSCLTILHLDVLQLEDKNKCERSAEVYWRANARPLQEHALSLIERFFERTKNHQNLRIRGLYQQVPRWRHFLGTVK